jgi:hypothetical protein
LIRPAAGAAARIAIALPDADAGDALAAAQTAERHGIDGIWLGSPNHSAPMADRYVLTALAAIAHRTSELRLGVILHGLAADELTAAETIHLAEDLSAVDNISNGRLEIAFARGGPGWVDRAELLLGLWTDGMELSDGLIVAVTPAPVQPRIPRLVIGDAAAARDSLGAGRWVESGDSEAGRGGRTVLSLAPGVPVSEWLGSQPGERLQALRKEVAAQRADEVVLVLSNATDDDLAAIGTVVGPCLRCAPDQIDRLAVHCFNWLREGEPSSRADTPEFAFDP